MKSQQPDDQNNVMLAVILSMAVLLGWNYFFAQPKLHQQQEQAQRAKLAAEQKAAEANGSAPAAATTGPAASPQATLAGAPAQPAATTREEALARSARIAIETPSIKGSVALKGGVIDDVVLVKYRETSDPASANVVLLSPSEGPKAYFARHGWIAQVAGQKLPDGETVWTQESQGALTPANPAKLMWDNGSGLVFRRTMAIDDNYMFTITDTVQNTSQGDVALSHFGRLFRFGKPKTEGFAILHEGFIGVPGDAGLKEVTYDDVYAGGEDTAFDNKTGGWLGITDKYWAAALVPDQKSAFKGSFHGEQGSGPGGERYLAEYQTNPQIAAAGQTIEAKSQFYAGAKQIAIIEDYEEKQGIGKFELMIDWGWFYFITKPFAHILNMLYEKLGNFGLAILALTVGVKLAFFPLANKSYESMAKMKNLQPQVEALKERFKDDRARQQEEMMKLYQKEKVNPAAGCLPILLQIPVFFALYKVLFVSIDMRHAPFYGWIHDLSAPDPTSLFNLFGLLPFTVPEILHVGIWPLIMGATMWFQMQLNPKQPDPVQQAVFAWMPLLFTFLLASFPAGLVIYWAWNNILSIAQQWYISHKNGADIHLMDNLKSTFGPILRLFGGGAQKKG